MSNELNAKMDRISIKKGNPRPSEGDDGDLTFRRTSDGLKLYIKAAGKWNGVKVGESFDELEKNLNNLQKIVSTIKQFRLPSTYSVTGDFKLDASGDIALSADGGDIIMDDGTNEVFKFNVDSKSLKIHNNADDYATFAVADTGDLTIATVGDGNLDSNLILDADGDIELNADGANITVKDGARKIAEFSGGLASIFSIYNFLDVTDYFQITVTGSGATIIKTIDSGATIGHLTIAPDGDLILDPESQKVIINTTDKLYLDGGGDTYITETEADSVQLVVGGDVMMQLTEGGGDGNHATFRTTTSVGFTRLEATFSQTLIIGSGGTDDTDINFRASNKYRLEMTGDIANMNLIFPQSSGNFLLVCTTNGDHDVAAWKVYESDETPATTPAVLWAGGSVPAFTDNGVDIVSFYWDATEQQAYGVASLAFATP